MMSLATDIAGVDRANEVDDFEVLYDQMFRLARASTVEGCRSHDEAGPHDDHVAALFEQPDRSAFYRFDHITATNRRHLVDQMHRPAVSASALAELASLIGAPADALEATVREWNPNMDSGATPDAALGRVVMRADRRDIAVGPFWASPMVLGVNFPAGGFRTTDAMAVVGAFGAPIPGLYAAGDAGDGPNPRPALGGIHISSAITFGFVAGRAAATGDRSARCALPALAEAPAPPGTVHMAIVDAAGRRLRVRRLTSGGRR